MSQVKANHPYGACVDLQTPEALSQCTRIVIGNGEGCILVGPDRTIKGFAKMPNCSIPDFAKIALTTAILYGGNRLDCYNINGFLPSLYCNAGFIPTGRVTFNPDCVSSDWNYEKFGNPEVVFMVHCGDPADVVARNYGVGYKAFAEYDYEKIRLFGPEEYNEAAVYQDLLISSKNIPDAHKLAADHPDKSREFALN